MKEYLKKLLIGICISYTSVSVTFAVINAITGMENISRLDPISPRGWFEY